MDDSRSRFSRTGASILNTPNYATDQASPAYQKYKAKYSEFSGPEPRKKYNFGKKFFDDFPTTKPDSFHYSVASCGHHHSSMRSLEDYNEFK
jgi:hypothetical protein